MTKKINLFFEYLLFVILLIFALIITLSSKYANATVDGVKLWFALVFPSLFPYLFITTILSSLSATAKTAKLLSPLTKRTFKVNGNVGYALFISLLSGYPVGAKAVADLKRQCVISDAEAVRASILCSNSSPAFLIGSVGTFTFNNRAFGLTLFCLHLFGVLINGFFFSFYKHKEKPTALTFNQVEKSHNLLYDGALSSVISVLVVGGLITVFYILTEILQGVGIFNPLISILSLIIDEQTAKAVIYGFFECTRGLKQLSLGATPFFTLPVALAICGFGGVSVIAQSLAFLKTAKIKTAPFLLSKATSAVIGFCLGCLFNYIF